MLRATLSNIVQQACRRTVAPRPGSQHHLKLPMGCTRLMSSQLPSANPPLSTQLPADSFQLLPNVSKAGSAEDELFEDQIQDVLQWWGSKRFDGIKRPYSAQDVVSKRGSLQQTYPSSLMARKLFNLLREKAKVGEPVHTSRSIIVNPLFLRLTLPQWVPSIQSR